MFLNEPQGNVDFWNLWENNKKLFFRKCIRLMDGNICEAEDALSAAMLKAQEKMFHYRDSIRNFKGWALRLTENVCLDQLRKHRRLISFDEIPESLINTELNHGCLFMESTENYNSREAILKGIFEMVDDLPRRLREPALLRFLYFESYRTIAGRLQITEENARKRIQEARSALKLHYGIEINGLLTLSSEEGGMEPESPAMKKMTEDARSVLGDGGFELEFSCESAWIVNTLPITGIDEDILVFLPLKPGKCFKGFESSLNYISRHSGGWKKHLELAQTLYAAGMWDQSEKMLQHVLKKHPRSFSAWMLLGDMLSKSGRTDEAEGLFRQAGSLVFRDSSRHCLAGMAAECRGDLNEAIALFERAGSLEPSNIFFRHAKGICLFRLGRHTDALRLFEDILAGNPGDIVSLAYCCEVSLILNRRKTAGKYIDSILEGNPNDFFGLTRKTGLNNQNGVMTKEERMRLQRITERFNQLVIIMKGPENEKFTNYNLQTSLSQKTNRKGGE
jgi:RNA polymerase sigma factor (sigma-70 family)